MANRKVQYAAKYITASLARGKLGLSRFQFDLRIERGILPKPTFIDPDTNVRYFDDTWLITANAILNSLRERSLEV